MKRSKNGDLGNLWKGLGAGVVALGFGFLLRLGGLAPFPPESALQAFLRIVPASIEEPSVQLLGEFANILGLVVASAFAVLIYGLLGVAFGRFLDPTVERPGVISSFEKALAYSLVPWLLFGLVILPLTGVSFFGIDSPF